MRQTSFPYQLEAIESLRDGFRKGMRRGLLCMLMGAGKSHVAINMMRLTAEKGNYSLFLCDRRMLADQAVERARSEELSAAQIMAGRDLDLSCQCQFGSKQTIISWLERGRIKLPDFKLIVTDECHRGISEGSISLYNRFPNAYLVGLSATPCLGDGGGMGKYYDFLVQPIQPSSLRSMGRIVPVKAFAPHVPNLKGVARDKDGDYAAKSLSERMTRENLVGDIAGWWKKLAENRPSLYFACDIAHATSIRDEFRAAGVPADMICDETCDDERSQIKEALELGKIKVCVNVDVCAEGIDWPFVSCIGLVRPTKRLRRYLQSTGRGMRACEGKTDCILIDHSGCVLYHGFPDTDRDWPIAPTDNIDTKNQSRNTKETRPIKCVKCSALFQGSRTCPACGHLHTFTKPAKDYAQGTGSLIEISKGDIPEQTQNILYQRFWATCIATAIKGGRTAGMAAGMFSKKFGIPPWQARVQPLPKHSIDWKKSAIDIFPGFAWRMNGR